MHLIEGFGIGGSMGLPVLAVLLATVVATHGKAADTPASSTAPPAGFATCRGCHSVANGAPSGVGPNLFGVAGGVAGGKPGYAYSPAMKASRLRWDRSTLDAYLINPKGVVPGTKMAIPGVTDAKKRRDIIEYLATLK